MHGGARRMGTQVLVIIEVTSSAGPLSAEEENAFLRIIRLQSSASIRISLSADSILEGRAPRPRSLEYDVLASISFSTPEEMSAKLGASGLYQQRELSAHPLYGTAVLSMGPNKDRFVCKAIPSFQLTLNTQAISW